MNRLRNGEKPNPKNGKRVVLIDLFERRYELDNMNGVTRSVVYGADGFEMLQNRSAYDAMVNSMLMLMGMEIESVEYYNIDGEEGE